MFVIPTLLAERRYRSRRNDTGILVLRTRTQPSAVLVLGLEIPKAIDYEYEYHFTRVRVRNNGLQLPAFSEKCRYPCVIQLTQTAHGAGTAGKLVSLDSKLMQHANEQIRQRIVVVTIEC